MATKYKPNSEKLAEFLAHYPLADTKTMYMFLRGRGSKNPFAKNALTLGAGTVRSMVSAGKLSSRKDGLYNLTKREADRYFDIEPYYKVNGNQETRKRIAKVSYIASVMYAMGADIEYNENEISFACSTVWRQMNPTISGTSRFLGVLNLRMEKLAVYDVSDENMMWQRRAEESLFTASSKERNVELDGIVLLTDKNMTEESISIVERTLKYLNGWKVKRNKEVSLRGFAPVVLSHDFKKVYLLNYEAFAGVLTNMILTGYVEDMDELISASTGADFSSSQCGKLFDCLYQDREAFFYLHNDLLRLIRLIHISQQRGVTVLCTEFTKDIVEYFIKPPRDKIVVIPKNYYGEEMESPYDIKTFDRIRSDQ